MVCGSESRIIGATLQQRKKDRRIMRWRYLICWGNDVVVMIPTRREEGACRQTRQTIVTGQIPWRNFSIPEIRQSFRHLRRRKGHRPRFSRISRARVWSISFSAFTTESVGSNICEGIAPGTVLVTVVARYTVSGKSRNPSSWAVASHQSGLDIPGMRQIIKQSILAVSAVRWGFYPVVSQGRGKAR